MQDALVDLTDLGYADVKDNFSDGALERRLGRRRSSTALPVDGGPMGMIYRTDIFEQVRPHAADHVGRSSRPPRRRSKDAGGSRLRELRGQPARNRPRRTSTADGAEPFSARPSANEGEIGINLNSPEIKEVLDYWDGLVDKGLGGHRGLQFTPEYIAGVIGGRLRHLPLGRLGSRLPPGRQGVGIANNRRQRKRTSQRPASTAGSPILRCETASCRGTRPSFTGLTLTWPDRRHL